MSDRRVPAYVYWYTLAVHLCEYYNVVVLIYVFVAECFYFFYFFF